MTAVVVKNRCFSISMPIDQFNALEQFAIDARASVSEVMRICWKEHGEMAAAIAKNKRILEESGANDVSELIFTRSAYPEHSDSKHRMRVYIHKKAFSDLKNMGKEIENRVMDFLYAGITSGSLSNIGDIRSIGNGKTLTFYRVGLTKLCALISPLQVTILSVDN